MCTKHTNTHKVKTHFPYPHLDINSRINKKARVRFKKGLVEVKKFRPVLRRLRRTYTSTDPTGQSRLDIISYISYYYNIPLHFKIGSIFGNNGAKSVQAFFFFFLTVTSEFTVLFRAFWTMNISYIKSHPFQIFFFFSGFISCRIVISHSVVACWPHPLIDE